MVRLCHSVMSTNMHAEEKWTPCRGLALLVLTAFVASSGRVVAAADSAILLEDWILLLKPHVEPDAFKETLCSESNKLRQQYHYSCTDTFRTLLRGLSGKFSRAAIRDLLRLYKDSVDQAARDRGFTIGDHLMTADDEANQDGLTRAPARLLPEQFDPVTWGLDRIDQLTLPLDKVYHYDSVGTGVHVYVLDSGIRASHQQFRVMASVTASDQQGQPSQTVSGTRVVGGFSALSGPGPDSTPDDCFGHGTHVAAIIGGLDNGVAKNVTLHPVKVLDCYGNANEATLLRGLEWVSRNLQFPAVVHMSLEGYYSTAVNAAIESLVTSLGVPVVASAGNRNVDACTVSPASAQSAITVGAIDTDGSRWYKSNWGPCLDLFAPGAKIISAVPWTDAAEASKSGTSMAAPFVTGVAALYLQSHPGASPADVAQRLLRSSLPGVVTDDVLGMATFTPSPPGAATWAPVDISSTPNRLLQSMLTVPAQVSPSVVKVIPQGTREADPETRLQAGVVTGGVGIAVSLLLCPSSQVNLTASVPSAWNGQPLADVLPSTLTFTPSDYNHSRHLLLQPNAAVAQGTYYVQLAMRSSDPRFEFAVQVFKVEDTREQVGETATVPRVIPSLPFNDYGTTILFRHDYITSPGNQLDTAPDVVYAFTPSDAMTVSVSTCGSRFDTVLLLGQEPQQRQKPLDQEGQQSGGLLRLDDTLANDDDPTCGSASRIDKDLQAGVTYYIVLSGFNGAAGDFVVAARCTSCGGIGGRGGGNGDGFTPPR